MAGGRDGGIIHVHSVEFDWTQLLVHQPKKKDQDGSCNHASSVTVVLLLLLYVIELRYVYS